MQRSEVRQDDSAARQVGGSVGVLLGSGNISSLIGIPTRNDATHSNAEMHEDPWFHEETVESRVAGSDYVRNAVNPMEDSTLRTVMQPQVRNEEQLSGGGGGRQEQESGIRNMNDSSNTGKSWLSVFKDRFEKELPHLEECISDDRIEDNVLKAYFDVADSCPLFRDSSIELITLLSAYIDFLKGISFSCTVGNSKELWLSSSGKVQSALRVSVTTMVLASLRQESCLLFVGNRRIEGIDKQIEKPNWLEESFICDSDVQFVHGYKEGAGGNKGRRLQTKKLGRKDCARFIVDMH